MPVSNHKSEWKEDESKKVGDQPEKGKRIVGIGV